MKDFLKSMNFNATIIDALETMDESTKKELKRYKTLYTTYLDHNLSKEQFLNSTVQIESRLMNNYHDTDRVQFLEKDKKWIDLILDFKIIKVGVLRFQYFPMDYVEIERQDYDWMPLTATQKEVFYSGRPLINVHVETKTDLSKDKVDASFAEAKILFQRIYPDVNFEGFVTRTWLIYPGIVSLLKPESNIAHFAKHFEVITSNKATYQALYRVYKTEDIEAIKAMPKETSLEKTIIENIDKLGVSFGFKPF